MNIKFGPHTIAKENVIGLGLEKLNGKESVYMVHKISKEPFITVKAESFSSNQDAETFYHDVLKEYHGQAEEKYDMADDAMYLNENGGD